MLYLRKHDARAVARYRKDAVAVHRDACEFCGTDRVQHLAAGTDYNYSALGCNDKLAKRRTRDGYGEAQRGVTHVANERAVERKHGDALVLVGDCDAPAFAKEAKP
jgi:hypothetical protein